MYWTSVKRILVTGMVTSVASVHALTPQAGGGRAHIARYGDYDRSIEMTPTSTTINFQSALCKHDYTIRHNTELTSNTVHF